MAIKYYNQPPYFDDFDEAKNYLRTLFRPGYSVQARELTQLQTVLQNQIGRFGEHMFVEGSKVIGGGATYNNEVDYIKVESTYNPGGGDLNVDNYYDEFEGTIITGLTTGVKAEVLKAIPTENTDPITLLVKYIGSSTNGSSTKFSPEEVIRSNGTTIRETKLKPLVDEPIGYGSTYSVSEGVWFINSSFVYHTAEEIVISKYSREPSSRIGLQIFETIKSASDDVTLNDNALGSPNEAAPGANRYSISLKLVVEDYDFDLATVDNYVQIAVIKDGVLESQTKSTTYNEIMKTLATRTYEESGNYTVRPYPISVREHIGGDPDKLSVVLDASVSYIEGSRIETISPTYLDLDRSRDPVKDVEVFIDSTAFITYGNYVTVNTVSGLPDITTFPTIQLLNAASAQIGTARVRSFDRVSTTNYRVYLFDIVMNGGQSRSSIAKLNQTSVSPNFSCNLVTAGLIENAGTNSALFPLSLSSVKTLESITVRVKRTYSTIVSDSKAIFQTGSENELFVNTDSSTITVVSTGNIVNTSGVTYTLGGATVGQELQVSGTAITAVNGQAVKILVTTFKRLGNAQAKQKTLVVNHNIAISSPNTTIGNYDNLGIADVYKLKAVYMSTGLGITATLSDQDITSRYELDNGQRDNFYDNGRIRLKPGSAAPTGQLLVVVDYFNHGSGDFFTVDSYTSSIDIGDIPVYSGSTGTYSLQNVVDFRPRKNNAGTGFTGTGSASGLFPANNSLFVADVESYLARKDKVYVKNDGTFGIVRGVSSLDPKYPADPDGSMILYNLDVAAYTSSPSGVVPTYIDNKRYTMRDIGKLDRRISNLEYYTTLSLLEKDVLTSSTLDDAGAERFRNGFVVDGFYGHNVGDVSNPDYKNSIDMTNGILRPHFYKDAFDIKVDGASGLVSSQKTGNMVHLPRLADIEIMKQPFASGVENLNPYLVFRYDSNLELFPSSDNWIDVEERPAVVIDQTGIYDAIAFLADAADVTGTQWNDWQTTWAGSTSTSATSFSSTTNGRLRTDTALTVTNTTTTSDQSRSGSQIDLNSSTVSTDLGSSVIDVNIVPFIRSRRIYFYSARLKPSTNLNIFFDDVNISAYARSTTDTQTVEQWQSGINDVEIYKGNTVHPEGSNTLKTNANGEIWGSFIIPSNGAIKFRTGQRLVRLTDSATNDMSESTTVAESTYAAQGLIQTVQGTVINTQVPQFETTELNDSRRIVERTTQATIRQTSTWESSSPDPLAQTFMIEEDGGAFITSIDAYFKTKGTTSPAICQIRPVVNGYPTSQVMAEKVLSHEDVNISANATVATTFTFSSPVYLKSGIEYAFVLKALDTSYEAWVSELGKYDITNPNQRITKQPHAGVLFKSSNERTWTADQFKDIKFTMRRAVFDINAGGEVRFTNNNIPKKLLRTDPFSTYNASKKVRVSHKNHGMFEGSKVTFSGVVEGGGSINGITVSNFNSTFVISDVEYDSYVITLPTNATANGTGGGSVVKATENKIANLIRPNIGVITLPNTNIDWSVKISSGNSLGSANVPYIVANNYIDISSSDNFTFTSPKCIPGPANLEFVTGAFTEVSGNGLYVKGVLSSDRDSISPMIDTERASIICVANKVDNAVAPNGYQAGINNKIFNLPSGASRFVPETSGKDNSGLTRYITRKVVLEEDAEDLKIWLDGNRPSGTFIDVYYRLDEDDAEVFNDQPWTLATPNKELPQTDDATKFSEAQYELNNIGIFSGFQVKIVLRSSNTSKVPQVKNFRVVALS